MFKVVINLARLIGFSARGSASVKVHCGSRRAIHASDLARAAVTFLCLVFHISSP
jgi:hypothetical protein